MNSASVKSGESWTRLVTVWTDRAMTARENLTGAAVTFKVYDAPGGAIAITGSATITNAAQGEITVSLAASQTDDYTFAVLYWMVLLTETGNRVTVVDDGKLTIERGAGV